jgi:L-amino acid N-acyltransferase YncA
MDSLFTIRLVNEEDVPGILAIYAPYILQTAVSFETEVPSREAFWQRIKKILEESPWLVAEKEGEIAGYAYAGPHRSRAAYQWNREVSAYVADKFQGKGLGKALYSRLFEILKQQGYANLLAGVVIPNPASEAFHRKMGFQKIGVYHKVGFKFGKWYDTSWWELSIRNEHPGDIRPYIAKSEE